MASAYVNYRTFYAFPAPGPPVPKREPPGVGLLRNLAKTAAVWFPHLHRRGLGPDADFATHAAPTRGAREVPERTEV